MKSTDQRNEGKPGQYTPMMEQYLASKREYPDALLFFRMGDFYEMFFEDARTASEALEIVLTARESAGEKVPMCGIPHHSSGTYIARLISKGFKVAICEQVEDPKKAIGIVRREVVRVVTPGTILEDYMLDEGRNNYLAAVYQYEDQAGLAYIDVSTGDYYCSILDGRDLSDSCISELLRIQPAECLLAADEEFKAIVTSSESLDGIMWSEFGVEDSAGGCPELQSVNEDLDMLELAAPDKGIPLPCIHAAKMLLGFIRNTYRTDLKQIKAIRLYHPEKHMALDASARKNLELLGNLKDGKKKGSLFHVLNYTATAMGQRLLRRWIEEPLMDLREIERRQDAVEELKEDLQYFHLLRDQLKKIADIDRLCGRLGGNLASPRDILAIRMSLEVLPTIEDLQKRARAELIQFGAGYDRVLPLLETLTLALNDEVPAGIKDGGVIRSGYLPEVDELRELTRIGKDWMLEYEAREKESTGIKHLKVGYNRVFGYYIEVSKNSISSVPGHYVRRQTLANNERYITQELKEYEDKILNARERLLELESECFNRLLETSLDYLAILQGISARIAELDVLCSLARAAYENQYVRPLLNNTGVIDIKAGRHPVVEKNLRDSRFVPNDLMLDRQNRSFALITGPNMGGKSTYMRQAALIAIMAQMGSFVPARHAEISVIDRVCTRVGASDDLSGGQSTFMVEMLEVASIIKQASPNSLIILDEVGRGTSTYDGISIAHALCEYLCRKLGAFTLFATHYHELTVLEGELPGFHNLSVSVLESGNQVSFLKRVLPGKADRSYGIHVARMAGLPDSLVERAGQLLEVLECSPQVSHGVVLEQPGLFDRIEPANPILEEMAGLDVDDLSARQALNLIARWKEML